MRSLLPVALGGVYLAWMAAWFWVFTYSFSPSFFSYHLDTRLPVLALAMFAIAVPPLSGTWAVLRSIRRESSPARVLAVNLIASGAPLATFWAVLAVWNAISRSAGRLAFEADEAMGNGIDFLFCFAVFVVSNLVVAAIVIGSRHVSRFRRSAERPAPHRSSVSGRAEVD